MANIKFTNLATTKLNTSITDTQTVFNVIPGSGVLFPEIVADSGEYFYATLVDPDGNVEIAKVISRVQDTMEVVRGVDNSIARSFPAESIFALRINAAAMEDIANTSNVQIATNTNPGIVQGTANAGSSSYGNVSVKTDGTMLVNGFDETVGTLGPLAGGTGQTSLQATRNAMGLGNTTGALPIANGGTGATTAAAARTNLGIPASGAAPKPVTTNTVGRWVRLVGNKVGYVTIPSGGTWAVLIWPTVEGRLYDGQSQNVTTHGNMIVNVYSGGTKVTATTTSGFGCVGFCWRIA